MLTRIFKKMLVCQFSHFLAFLWGCLSYFLDYVDKDIHSKMLVCQCFMRLKSADHISVGPKFFYIASCVCYMCSYLREKKKIPKYQLGRGMRPSY